MRSIQTAVPPHPLKIGHMFIWTYLLVIAHTTTFWNIYYSFWNTLCVLPEDGRENVETCRKLYINFYDTITISKPAEESQVFSTEIVHKAQIDAKTKDAVIY